MRPIDADALKKRMVNEPVKAVQDVDFQAEWFTRIADTVCHMIDMVDDAPTVEPASPWHRVEEPPKEHGPFLCAAKSERNGQTHWFFELCWYADGDLKDVVFDAEQDSGFYSWSASQDRDIDSMVDYWMPIEPPKED